MVSYTTGVDIQASVDAGRTESSSGFTETTPPSVADASTSRLEDAGFSEKAVKQLHAGRNAELRHLLTSQPGKVDVIGITLKAFKRHSQAAYNLAT